MRYSQALMSVALVLVLVCAGRTALANGMGGSGSGGGGNSGSGGRGNRTEFGNNSAPSSSDYNSAPSSSGYNPYSTFNPYPTYSAPGGYNPYSWPYVTNGAPSGGYDSTVIDDATATQNATATATPPPDTQNVTTSATATPPPPSDTQNVTTSAIPSASDILNATASATPPPPPDAAASPSPDPTPSAEPGSNEAQIQILQAEIDTRAQTNKTVQGLIDDYNADTLKVILANSVIDATGKINKQNFDKLPPEIQKEMKQFEHGHWIRDAGQAVNMGAGVGSQFFSTGSGTFNQGRIEIARNELFIIQLQQKIASLRSQ